MSDTVLKSCPFCGYPAEKKTDDKGNKWIECIHCGASSWRSDHITYAVKWWNRRVNYE